MMIEMELTNSMKKKSEIVKSQNDKRVTFS